MGKWLSYIFIALGLTTISDNLFAVAPVISYTPSTNVYTVGTAITTLTPTITNGVSAIGFGAATALTGATLSNPRGIGIDPSGNVYVANMGNNTISKYGPTGAYIGTFGTGATMSSPDYIVFDSSGNAYVLNLTTGTVFKYNSGGVYQSTIITGLAYALGMTIDASNNIYIADQGANAVKKYNTAGTVLLTLPTANFSTPLGVDVDASGNIYVLNNGTGNVTKYNSAGTFQSTFITGFTSAQSIVIDGAGNIYVGDNAATNTVYVYNQSGTLLTSKVVNNPEGIAVDNKGDLFASARYSNTMSEFTPTGGFFLSGTLPAGLSFNSTTGSIIGTPTAAMATTVYTITAYNASGSGSTTVTITVNPTASAGGGGSACSSGAIALTASGSTPAGGVYNWYAALSGGASLGTGGTYTTPVLTTTTTYYVDYTLNGATTTPRTAVTATINAAPVLATAPTTPTASLYFSYPLTGNANDVSGNGNNGTVQNAPTLVADRYGAANSAYSFNGTNQYISTTTASASPGPQNLSISVWFKTTTAGGRLVGYGTQQTGSSTNYDRHIYMSNSGQLYFGVYSATWITINTTTSYADGIWHHAVATLSSTTGANLYVDGALQVSSATMPVGQAYGVNGYWRVGYDNLAGWPSAPTNYYFQGSLDDIAVYNTALTASQVYTLYGGGSAPTCPGSTMNLQVNTVAGATYSWSGPNGFTSASQNPAIANAAAVNAGVYTATVTSASGCTSQLHVTGVVSGSGPAISTAPTTPTAGLYLSYPFTANANDVSGNGNNGTLQNAPTLIADRYGATGSAYSFNGSTQYVSTTTLVATPGPQNFSISVWFNTSSAGGKLVGFGNVQTGSSGSYDRHIYMSNSGQIYFGLFPGTVKTINTVSSYADGNWHHVVATESTTNGAKLYVDGVLQAADATMTASQSYAGYWRIGYDNTGGWTNAPTNYYFNGSLDDIAIYNTELTQAQVYVLYGVGSSSFCAGNTFSLTANTVAGATYAWTGPGGFSSTLQNPTVTNAVAGTYTLIVVSASGCTSTINLMAPSNVITSTWTGGAGTTNPTTAGNWDQLPAFNTTSNLVIPAGLTFYPSLTANESIYGLTIASGATFSLNNFTLNVGCNIINNASTSGTGILYGAFNSSQITWNGSVAAQSYTGTNTINTAQLGSMTVNNSVGGTVTINSGPVDIYSTLTITQGNLAVAAAPAALTLKSTATQSAGVAAIPAGSSITGTVNVERYITGGAGYRGYRLISSPVYAATVAPNNVYSINYLQAGAFLTGSAGGGFDKTGNPTIYLYREDQAPNNQTFTTGNFWGISKINNATAYNYFTNGGSTVYNIPVGNGIMFFFRGNRASALVGAETVSTYTPVAVTMSASGTLNQGQVIVHDWYTPASANLGWTNATANTAVRGFNLVGNPYASSIDWEQYNTTTTTTGIYANNVGTTIYELNPATNNYDTYKTGGTHTNNGSRTIASGQAFYVLAANNTAPQLIFNETAKTATQNTGLSLFMAEKADVTAINSANIQQYLRLQLAKDSINTDDVYIGFDAGAENSYVFNEDAPYKQGNGKVSLATISSDNIDLAINKLPLPKLSQTVIPLNVNAVADGTYRLNMTEIVAIPKLYEIWLMDAYKKDSLDMRHNLTYVFDLYKADTNSFGSRRFSLVIRQNQAIGIHLLNFTATKTTPGAALVWVTENEANYSNFTVEKSTDNGKTFNILGGFSSSDLGTYNFLDKGPLSGANQYRLKIEDVNGIISYSKVVTLTYTDAINTTASNITVYPNPTSNVINVSVNKNNTVNALANLSALDMQNASPGLNLAKTASVSQSYNIKVISVTGYVVLTATSSQSVWQNNISGLPPGTYIIQVVNKNDNSLVGKSTFIKL